MKDFSIAVIYFSILFLEYRFNGTCSEAQMFNFKVSKIIFISDIGAFIFDNLLILPMSFVYFLFSRLGRLFSQCSFSFQEGHVAQRVKFCLKS